MTVRIAQVAPPIERTPPPGYGGIEYVVSVLTDELVRRGHEVTLYATGDSVTLARLRAVCARPLRGQELIWPLGLELAHLARVLDESQEYDVIHNHYGPMLMAFSHVAKAPMLTTIHGPMPPEAMTLWDTYAGFYNTISRASKSGFPDRGYLGVVYNGIDVASFPFQRDKENFLLFLARISPEKGTHLAIEATLRANRTLIIAGKIDRVDSDYWEKEVRPWIDGERIQYVGEADARAKRDLLARAACLLHPVTWPEPFGLNMAEAMACGTPVIAMRRGSIPEVIANGETGYVVDTVEEMVAAIGRVNRIEPACCRTRVEQLFSTQRMVDGYERLYDRIVDADPTP